MDWDKKAHRDLDGDGKVSFDENQKHHLRRGSLRSRGAVERGETTHHPREIARLKEMLANEMFGKESTHISPDAHHTLKSRQPRAYHKLMNSMKNRPKEEIGENLGNNTPAPPPWSLKDSSLHSSSAPYDLNFHAHSSGRSSAPIYATVRTSLGVQGEQQRDYWQQMGGGIGADTRVQGNSASPDAIKYQLAQRKRTMGAGVDGRGEGRVDGPMIWSPQD